MASTRSANARVAAGTRFNRGDDASDAQGGDAPGSSRVRPQRGGGAGGVEGVADEAQRRRGRGGGCFEGAGGRARGEEARAETAAALAGPGGTWATLGDLHAARVHRRPVRPRERADTDFSAVPARIRTRDERRRRAERTSSNPSASTRRTCPRSVVSWRISPPRPGCTGGSPETASCSTSARRRASATGRAGTSPRVCSAGPRGTAPDSSLDRWIPS